jgi:hypothetical protein
MGIRLTSIKLRPSDEALLPTSGLSKLAALANIYPLAGELCR